MVYVFCAAAFFPLWPGRGKGKSDVIKQKLVVEDSQNMQKVAAGRLDVALIDTVNFRFSIKGDLKGLQDKLQLNEKVLEVKPLGICFKNATYEKGNQKLKEALAKTDTKAIVKTYLDNYFK